MKVHKIVATLSVVLGIGIAGYALVKHVKTNQDNYSQNLEALSKQIESSSGGYSPKTYKCKGDDYKYMIICKDPGSEMCIASDCNF